MLSYLYATVEERLKVGQESFEEDLLHIIQLEELINEAKSKQELFSNALVLTKRCIEYCLLNKIKLEKLVSEALKDIFNRKMNFRLVEVYGEDSSLRGLKFAISMQEGYEDDPEESLGTGHLFVASLLFHCKLLILLGNSERIIVLDEPFAHVNAVAIPNMWKIMEVLSKKYNIQFVIVTHSDHHGKTYQMDLFKDKDDEYTVCKEIEE